jgi:phosphoglycerate dehydrogenase-like enzyme
VKILVALYSPVAAWNIPPAQVDRLRTAFPQHQFHHATSEEQATALAPGADVAFMAELRSAHFAAARQLRWIHSSAAGVGNMLFPELVRSDVVLTNSSGVSADSIAEHVLGLTLALFRKLPDAFRSQSARHWAQNDLVAPPPLRHVQGARVLIVGLGSIGAACAWRLAALGATVTGIRRRLDQPTPPGVSLVAPLDRLREFLPSADVVVISAAQTGATRGLIGESELSLMPADAILINVSRGKLVDERALIAALRQGRIGGAGLDVFEHEPLAPDSTLWGLPNAIITPHMAGFRPDHWDAVTALFAENLRRFERGEPLQNVVDKSAGY